MNESHFKIEKQDSHFNIYESKKSIFEFNNLKLSLPS